MGVEYFAVDLVANLQPRQKKKYLLLSSLSILLAAVHKSRLEPGPKISRPKLPFYRRPKRPREKKKSSAFEERKSEQKGILESSCKNWAHRFTFFPGLSLEIRLLPTIELVLSLADVALDEVKMVQVLHDVPLSLYFSRGCKIERENIFLPSDYLEPCLSLFFSSRLQFCSMNERKKAPSLPSSIHPCKHTGMTPLPKVSFSLFPDTVGLV